MRKGDCPIPIHRIRIDKGRNKRCLSYGAAVCVLFCVVCCCLLSYHNVSSRILLCHVVLRCIMFCYVMPCCVML